VRGAPALTSEAASRRCRIGGLGWMRRGSSACSPDVLARAPRLTGRPDDTRLRTLRIVHHLADQARRLPGARGAA